MTAPIAVVVKGWPRLSETFIAQELVALEEAGLELAIWSLRHPTDKKTHPLHDRLRAPVHYLPEYLWQEPERVWQARHAAKHLPGYAQAYRIWRKDLQRDANTNRIRRFGQACVLATELPAGTPGLYAHFLHTPASVARYAAIMLGLPWSASAHAKDIWTSPDWEIAEKLGDNTESARFVATCTAYGAERLRSLSAEPDNVHLVYHGLDLARFPAPPDRDLRPIDAPFHMVSVGRLVEKKGFDNLIDALALLPETLDWHWTHIGGGDLSDDLASRAKTLGVDARITWRGPCDQPDVIAAMREADLFVLPSRIAKSGDRDGLPNVLMESASQKLAILSTPVAAIPEFVKDGVHGRLSSDAPVELAKAIADMAENPAQTAQFADAAHARLLRDFAMHPGIARLHANLKAMTGQ